MWHFSMKCWINNWKSHKPRSCHYIKLRNLQHSVMHGTGASDRSPFESWWRPAVFYRWHKRDINFSIILYCVFILYRHENSFYYYDNFSRFRQDTFVMLAHCMHIFEYLFVYMYVHVVPNWFCYWQKMVSSSVFC